MHILKKAFNSNSLVSLDTSLFEYRVLSIEGVITQEMADDFAKAMIELSFIDTSLPIHLLINTDGGEIDSGLKMCNIVSKHPCTVNAYCFSKAYSMGAILFESVNGARYMVGDSKLMIHQPSIVGIKSGKSNEIMEISQELQKKNNYLLSIVSKRSGININRLKKETVKDRYYDAKEAVSLSLADKCIDFVDMFNIIKESVIF